MAFRLIDLYDYRDILVYGNKTIIRDDAGDSEIYDQHIDIDSHRKNELLDDNLFANTSYSMKAIEGKIFKGSPYQLMSSMMFNDEYSADEYNSEGIMRGPSQTYNIIIGDEYE